MENNTNFSPHTANKEVVWQLPCAGLTIHHTDLQTFITVLLKTSMSSAHQFLEEENIPLQISGHNYHIQVSSCEGWVGATHGWDGDYIRDKEEQSGITWLYKPPCLDTSCFCRGESFLSDTLIVVWLSVQCMVPPAGGWTIFRCCVWVLHKNDWCQCF